MAQKSRARKGRPSRPAPRADRPAAPSADHRLLELQHGAGNAAVSSLVARTPLTQAPPDPARLSPADAEDALQELGRRRLDDASIRAVQAAVGTAPTGTFVRADAQALSHFRVQHGLTKGGELDGPALNALIREQAAVGMEQEMIHLVIAFSNVDTGTDTLSIRFDPTLSTASAVSFEAGTLRRIAIGREALKSARTLRAAIRSQLAADPVQAMLTPGPAPAILTPDEASGAAGFNSGALYDKRSALAIQAIVGAPRTGTFDDATSQFIAGRQRTLGLSTHDGTIDDEFFNRMVESLNGSGDFEAMIRLVVDYRRLQEGAVIDASFDRGLDPARTYRISSAGTGAPMSLSFGPAAFAGQDPPAIVHTIAHAYEDARLRLTSRSQRSRDFLAYKVELISKDLTEEPFGFFCRTAVQALDAFRNLDHDERVQLWNDFEEVRTKLRDRFFAATPAEQQSYDGILQDWLGLTAP